ncbi:MAG: metallophosphoesterase [Nanoarchaeota archaeon]
MDLEILNLIRNKGLLLEKDIFEILNNFTNIVLAKEFLEQIERVSGQKFITKNILIKNIEYVKGFVGNLEGEDKDSLERVFVKLGLSLEVVHQREEKKLPEDSKNLNYKVFYAQTTPDKKLEVSDFSNHFRARYYEIQKMLMSRPELQKNLVSIGKISSERTSLSIIGILTEKRTTKNKNIILQFEDLTGKISTLVKVDNKEVFSKAEELQLDDIVGVKASGNRDILFLHDIIFPDSINFDKTKFEEDISIAFLSDLHCGSNRHLGKSFERFLEWINSDHEAAKKIRYLFFVGDNVDGVGIFPGQEELLDLKSMKEQYLLLSEYLNKIPKHITMFMCPGQHDASRVAEPQPIISKKYAPKLYDIENLVLVTNPTMVKLLEGNKEFKVLMYHGASIHNLINEIKELREIKAHMCPAKAIKHMLKRRHLGPTHSENVYIPNADKDPLVISEVPDVLCTGEVHRLDIENYNGVLIITGSCWQAQTPFEEKIGNIPDPAKVPVLNLKTRELKIFDFGDDEEMKKEWK